MKRSMADLRMKGEPAPYYIEYEIDDVASMRAVGEARRRRGRPHEPPADAARAGAGRRLRVRQLAVRHAGSRRRRRARAVRSTAPLDDDYDAMRRQIWLTTDAAYKRAVSVFAKKKAAFQNRAATDPLADFSRESRSRRCSRRCSAARRRGSQWVDRVKAALGGVRVDLGPGHVRKSGCPKRTAPSYYLNSEGFKAVAPIRSAYLPRRRRGAGRRRLDGTGSVYRRRKPARGSAADGGPDVPRRRCCDA